MAHRPPQLQRSLALLLLCATGFTASAVPAASPSILEQQRLLFREVFESVERGDWSAIDKLTSTQREQLREYVLWPDIQAAYWRATIPQASAADIAAFLDEYGTLRPARQLRYRYALHLARIGDLPGFRRIYEQFYQGQEIARLDCLSLQAELKAGRTERVNARATALWLIGKSQVAECDPVFKYLDEAELLSPALYRKRYELAIDAREFRLARWLAKKIDEGHVNEAAQWSQAQAHPETFLKRHSNRADDKTTRNQLVYAVERLTYRDPDLAHSLWTGIDRRTRFKEEQRFRTARHIALWSARDNLPGAYDRLQRLPAAAVNSDVRHWRARSSLRAAEWDKLLVDIAAMPDSERNSEEWQYWRAVALDRLGQMLAARASLEALATERSYYGFLAADELDEDYAFDDSQLPADESVIAALESRPGIIRARELFLVGQDSSGRSEWDAVVRTLEAYEKKQAAIMADRWGWHSRAISAAAKLGEYDDLSLRYPLPHQPIFERSSSAANISPTWAYGIARSESLFMPDVRSHAGAVGLMQLMPATGRQVAREIRLRYLGIRTLTDPESNIKLGTSYLGQMAERYGGNAVLATAAYNAGPHRVDRWLPDSGSIDARIWIENIPFNETRKYVKRVLAAQAIFHWRMTGEIRRVSDELLVVRAVNDTPQLAHRHRDIDPAVASP